MREVDIEVGNIRMLAGVSNCSTCGVSPSEGDVRKIVEVLRTSDGYVMQSFDRCNVCILDDGKFVPDDGVSQMKPYSVDDASMVKFISRKMRK